MLNDPANGFNSFCLFLQNVIASIKDTSESSTRKQPGINYTIHRGQQDAWKIAVEADYVSMENSI